MKKTALEDLDIKISLVLERYAWLKREHTSLKEDNNELKKEIKALNLFVAEKNQIIHKLKEEDEFKELEFEDIAFRISEAMGLIDKKEAVAFA